ncbi:MAG: hypothetical protein AAF762_10850 [Pseudomonadota bacterium]
MRKLLLFTLLIATPAAADVTGPGGKVVECYCTDTQGARVELGQSICLVVDGRAFMAQCDMSLNVPIWRDTGAGCLSSSLSNPFGEVGQPLLQSFPVDAPV